MVVLLVRKQSNYRPKDNPNIFHKETVSKRNLPCCIATFKIINLPLHKSFPSVAHQSMYFLIKKFLYYSFKKHLGIDIAMSSVRF